jgi:hypothetical protein
MILLAVGGCSFKEQIAQNALDYNYSVEQAHNRLTLLNILRAKDRRPMHFTRLGQVTGNFTSEATGTATASIGRPDTSGDVNTNVVGLESSGTYASSPSFVIQNLDSKEFYSGILRPVPPELLQLYWNQGWPKPLLVHMFVGQVYLPFKDNPDEVCYIESYPPDRERFEIFAKAVDLFLAGDPIIVQSRERVALGRPIVAARASRSDIETLVEAQRADLSAAIEGDAIQLVKESEMVYELAFLADDKVTRSHIRTVDQRGGLRRSRGPCRLDDLDDLTTDGADIHLRAPQGMIYFLGELVRVQWPTAGQGYVPEIPFHETRAGGVLHYVDKEPIFRVVKESDQKLAVAVPYQGAIYGVPEGEVRSLQALSLVEQVFALFTSAKDLPSADTIRVAN